MVRKGCTHSPVGQQVPPVGHEKVVPGQQKYPGCAQPFSAKQHVSPIGQDIEASEQHSVPSGWHQTPSPHFIATGLAGAR